MTAPRALERRLFPVEEAAHYIGISKRSMWQLIKDGEVLKVTIRSRTLVDRADLDAYIERIKKAS